MYIFTHYDTFAGQYHVNAYKEESYAKMMRNSAAEAAYKVSELIELPDTLEGFAVTDWLQANINRLIKVS